jgi:O-antigen/teichoic acid export membrane protein
MTFSSRFLVLVFVRATQIVIAFATLRILTFILTTDELANYYLILAIMAFFNLVFLNPAGMYFIRNILAWDKKNDLVNVLLVFLGYVSIISVISVMITMCLLYCLNYDAKFNDLHLVLFVFFAVLISTIHRNLLSAINTLGFRIKFGMYLISTIIIGFVFSCLFFFLFSQNALIWLTGVVFSELIFIYVLFRIYSGKSVSSIGIFFNSLTLQNIEHVRNFCIPVALTTLFMWGQNISYRFIVDYKYSPEVLAEIAIAFGIATAVFSSLESIAMQHYHPIFLKKILDKDKDTIAQEWNAMAAELLPIYLLTTIFVILFSKPLLILLVDSKYHHLQYFVMVAALFELFRVLTNLLNNASQAVYQTTVTIAPYALGGSVATLSLLMLNLNNNTVAIPMVLVGSYMLTLLLMFYRLRQLLEMKISLNLFLIVIGSFPLYLFRKFMGELDIYSSLLIFGSAGLYFLLIIFILIKDAQKRREICR